LFANPLFNANATEQDIKNIHAFFDIVCTRADGQWCILTLEDKFCEVGEGENTNVDCLIQDLNTLCLDRCFKKILAKLWLFAEPSSQEAKEFETMLKFACVRDGSDYCLVRWANAHLAFNESCSDGTFENEGCNNALCKTEAGEFVNTMGCCMQTYIDFAKGHGTPEEVTDATDFENGIQASPCDYTLLPACPRQTGNGEAQKKFYIRMTWSYAANNNAEVRDTVQSDLAGFLGVPKEDVELVFFEKDNEDMNDDEAGVAVEFKAKGQTDTETNAFGNDFDEAISQGNLNLPLTAQAYSSQGVLTTSNEASDDGVSASSSLSVMAALSGAAVVVASL